MGGLQGKKHGLGTLSREPVGNRESGRKQVKEALDGRREQLHPLRERRPIRRPIQLSATAIIHSAHKFRECSTMRLSCVGLAAGSYQGGGGAGSGTVRTRIITRTLGRLSW